MQIRVYYEDTDTGGVVYHSQYLNFCERARSEAFFSKGLMPNMPQSHFVAKRVEADYISSAKLGDMLEVTTELIEMKNASFKLKQIITKEQKRLFEMLIILAHVTFEGKPQKIDAPTKELIESLFAR